MRTPSRTDDRLRTALQNLGEREPRYWEFRRQAQRCGVHGLFQYPAMMVPKMQGDVLDSILVANDNIHDVWDPFVGAGTTLTESMARGCNFFGLDINPLAILICEAKSSLFSYKELARKANAVIANCLSDRSLTIDVDFPGRAKWFSRKASIRLSRIRRSIESESSTWARKIMWVVFAETIRRTSNTRTSTYKLHVRLPKEIEQLPDPIHIFEEELREAVERFRYHEEIFASRDLLRDGKYRAETELKCDDIRNKDSIPQAPLCDLMITSPPYGDNRSTVSYGQFSYLALSWIPLNDLPHKPDLISNAYAIDGCSLGGRMAEAQEKAVALSKISPTFCQYYKILKTQNDRSLDGKVASFLHDFFDALSAITQKVRSTGYLAWTLGDRTVGGMPVPFVDVCRELQETLGLSHVVSVRRRIPSKRTPGRNSISKTMGAECLLLMRRH